MTPLFSLTRNLCRCSGVLILPNYLHLPRPINNSPPLLFHSTTNSLNLHQIRSKAGFLSQFHPPSATFSSFAEAADNEPTPSSSSSPSSSQSESEMAKAFNISSTTASAICVCIAFAALTVPLAMKSLGQGASFKIKALSYATLLSGFFMAWNIGANDVANAMGTSVGSGALTLPQAVLTAAVLEFSGALLMGTHVTSTMQKGILVAGVFQGKDSLLFAGLISSLAAAGSWLQVCIYFIPAHIYLYFTFCF